MASTRETSHWLDTQRVIEPRARRDDLASPATQIVGDREAYLGQATGDVGRRISEDQVELFVSGDAALSLQAEFQRLAPEFIVLHDLGLAASLRLLNSMAGPAGARVQRLSIRRQGQGVALAVVPFVEVALADGSPVRVYSTDVQGDTTLRAQFARILLAHSRLGVLMIGEVPPHALTTQLGPLHESILRGPWPNRDLLLVPLGSSIGLAAPAAQLGHNTPVAVHVTPHAARSKHVWTFVGGAWNRLHGMPGGERALQTELSRAVPKPRVPTTEATTEPMPLEPMGSSRQRAAPETAAVTPMPVPGAIGWSGYVQRCALIKGVQACCVFDTHSMAVLASAGDAPAPQRLASQGAALLASLLDASRALGLGPTQPEAQISTAHHHLLLRAVPGHPGVALHLVLQAHGSNLALARMQLDRINVPV
jgi:hypothetical protein